MLARLRLLARDSTPAAWTAGLIAVVVSFAGPMLLVLEAARAGELTEQQTVSWVWALATASGAVTLVLSLTMRVPVIAAWSIPGSVLLIEALQRHSFQAAVGTYLIVGIVSAVLGLTPWFSRLLRSIPRTVTSGLLAGILLPFCLDAARAGTALPLISVLMVMTFMVARRLAPVAAVPTTVLLGLAAVLLSGRGAMPSRPLTGLEDVLAIPSWTTPHVEAGALLSLGLPLLLVTMAGQNLPGVALMRTLGYRFATGPPLVGCGVASAVFAPFGAHAINLATVTGAVCAGPEAHPARRRRYVAGVSCGVWYLVIGAVTPLFLMLLSIVPGEALTVMAGLALLGALMAALGDLVAPADRPGRSAPVEAGVVTLIITASGIEPLGLASPVWGAAAGVAVHLICRRRSPAAARPRTAQPSGAPPGPRPPDEALPARDAGRLAATSTTTPSASTR